MGKKGSKSTTATKQNKISTSAWAQGRTPSRGPKPALSIAEIAHAAILVADKEGLEAVTMQRVAQAVEVTTMALYRYFPGKSDLLAVMIDAAGGTAPEFGNASTWKDRLREWARLCAAIYRDHPWFLEATTVRRSVLGPNELSWMEAALMVLAEAALSPKESYYAFLTIVGHVRSHATFEQIKSHGGSPQEWIRELTRLMRSQCESYSTLQAVLGSGALSGKSGEAFEYGLNCILAGIGNPEPASRAKVHAGR